MIRAFSLLSLLTLPVLLGAGCTASERTKPCTEQSDCPDGSACLNGVCTSVDCISDSDCGTGETCIDYTCQTGSGCESDGQCPVGRICVDSLCTPGCRVDSDCPDELLCIAELGPNGSCAECRMDADCPSGVACMGNQCRAECQSTADCPEGFCEPASGTCVDCLQDGHCPEGQVCLDNLCLGGCRADGECDPDQICIDGGCRPGCRENGDCPSGFCDPATWQCAQADCLGPDDCSLGQLCIQGACVEGCQSDRDCPDDQTCLPDEGAHGICAQCLSDEQCPTGLRCVSFVCSDQCQIDQDCPDGYCHPQAQVCVSCVTDEHCGPQAICEGGQCQSGCREDANCNPGQICVLAACQDGCREDSSCPDGQICDQDTCRPGCRSDSDCQNGTCDQNTWQCVGFDCSSDDDCQLGQLCTEHACVPGCRLDRDCPPAQVCDSSSGPNGTCVDCLNDGHCLDPDYPTCLNQVCEPECRTNEQCPADQACINLHCEDLVQECEIQLTPAQTVDFGSVALGSTVSQAFALSNLGNQACQISALEVRQGMFFTGDFHLASNLQTPFSLSAAETLMVDVVFAPGSEGQHVSTFWVVSDDPDLLIGATDLLYCGGLIGGVQPGEACVPLLGDGVVMDVQAVPAEVQFGRVTSGCESRSEQIRFYNLGGEVTVQNMALDNLYDPNFSIDQMPNTPFSVPTDGQFEAQVVFSPGSSGVHQNSLVVQFDNLPPLSVTLSGQGVVDSDETDIFNLPDDVMVDVLWVVDNSGSMGEEQQALAANFDQFIQWAQTTGVDYHVGVVSTEVNDPETGLGSPPRDVIPGVLVHAPGRPRFITPDTQNPEAAFADNVQLGTCCSDEQEAGLQSSWMALSPPLLFDPQTNGGFIRPAAKLYVVYVSDETDQSIGPVDFFVDYMNTLKGGPELVTLSAVCGDMPSGCYGNMGDAMAAPRYHEALQATDGLFQSICQEDWSQMMLDLGEHAFAPTRMFRLSRLAVWGTITVTVDGSPVGEASAAYAPDGWTYLPDENAIWFGDHVLPPNGSTVVVDYTTLCL